jgi:hypothetical protein
MRIIITILFPILLPLLSSGQDNKLPECPKPEEHVSNLRDKKSNELDRIRGFTADKLHFRQKTDSILKAYIDPAEKENLVYVREKKDSLLDQYLKINIDAIDSGTLKDTIRGILDYSSNLWHEKLDVLDSIKGFTPEKWDFKQEADSILNTYPKPAKKEKLVHFQERKDSLLGQYRKLAIDTVGLSTIKDTVRGIFNSALGTKLQNKANSKKIIGIKERLEEIKIDSTANFRAISEQAGKEAEKQAAGLDEIKAFQKEQAQFNDLKFVPDGQKKDMGNLIDNDQRPQIGKPKLKTIPKEKIDQYKGKLRKAQGDLTKLKKKYSEVSSANDLSTAVKKNSLKGKTIKERLVIGGNFQAWSFEPVTLDISPVLGYRVNKLFQAGVGVSSRYIFTYDQNLLVTTQAEGYKAFLSHDIFRDFFGYSEFERQKLKKQVVQMEEKEYPWKNAWHVGVGRSIQLGSNISVQAMMLYNILFDRADQNYNRRWNMKVGVQFNLKNKKNSKKEEK